MFTGLVEGLGQIVRLVPQGPDARVLIAPPWPVSEAVVGESVAVDGACLTVTKLEGQAFWMDVSAETLSRTTLGGLKTGVRVNLERAMQLGDRLGGHLVTGHVDCIGTVARLSDHGSSVLLEIEIPPEHLQFVVEKGSVAVSGVSLTVNQVSDTGFSLNIIPHTMSETTLHLAKRGGSVNIETDLIGKYVARLLPGRAESGQVADSGGSLSAEDMKRMGF